MSYRAIEDEVAARLYKELKPFGVEAVAMPSVNADKKQRRGARITVGYAGSEFEDKTPNNTSQLEIVTLSIIIEAPELQGKEGIYALLQSAKLLLLGYRPKNCQAIRLVSIEATNYHEGIWQYMMTVKTNTFITSIQTEDVGPIFQGLTFETVDYQFEEFQDEVFRK